MDEQTIRLGAACAFLWAAAVPDHKTRRIPVCIIAVFLVAVLAADLWTGGGLVKREYWTGAMPGLLFLLLSLERSERGTVSVYWHAECVQVCTRSYRY